MTPSGLGIMLLTAWCAVNTFFIGWLIDRVKRLEDDAKEPK